jgi:hypothetical protein
MGWSQCGALFPVNADDLLGAGDDPGFADGLIRGVVEDGIQFDALASEQLMKALSIRALAALGHEVNLWDELSKVFGDVCRPSRIKGFAQDFHNGDRRFRGDARDFSPDELIEDHLSDDEDSGGSG